MRSRPPISGRSCSTGPKAPKCCCSISHEPGNRRAGVGRGLPLRVAAVISNVADAAGLDFARSRGIPTAVVNHRDYPSREEFDAELAQTHWLGRVQGWTQV